MIRLKNWIGYAAIGLLAGISTPAEEIQLNRPEDWEPQQAIAVAGDAMRIKGSRQLYSKAIIQADPAKTYRLLGTLKAVPDTPPAPVHYGILPLDGNKQRLYITQQKSDTVLVADAQIGDNVLQIADGSQWRAAKQNRIAFDVKADAVEVPKENILAAAPVKIENSGAFWKVTLAEPLPCYLKKGTPVCLRVPAPPLYFSVARSSEIGICDPSTTSKTMWYPEIKYFQVMILANWKTLPPEAPVPELEMRNLRLEVK